METVNNIELKDETVYPDEDVLKKLLGRSYVAYCKLLKIYDEYGMEHGWRYYKDGKAWLYKVQKKKKTVVWMSAWRGYMKATVYFPEKHINDIYKLDISSETVERIKNTKNTGKSKPCIFEVRNMKVLDDMKKVMELKMSFS